MQLWLFLPVVIAGWLTGLLVRKAGVGGGPGLGSGANLGSRKHLGGGSGAGTRSVTWVQWRVCVLVFTAWVPCVVFAAFRWPVEVAIGLCMAGLGLWLLTAREHRP
ncbi:hypothetical protein [Brevibacterium samyangense]|uniref:hypothetical protein n=1 Tax=Brevibacterium samyangense TaxID=366888 RepID=UPI0031DEB372